ncbi:type IV toxin-antitoxin system AbiEi family antitoxin domain-containing protein [Nocardioides sp. AE5]|uniref:type IV toxin-antitoxin system AbiEi family antitoxin domain-containing protein n=1 Tax=Nocardioides sp. AE5 TaxID=2962573 RepID=UPI0028826DC0|nr:type IV toxin-antitoxin system AbiEi family antitoxin domain-containing protein [Nocardioides sp. AE5]MDT0202916.1 type IV toxin-antitoxin system AbiEi family antitoxin domain-containing protein [Nocardioides sp. AE5]
MDLWGVQERQAGVVSRRQVLAAGRSDNDIRRLVRRRDLSLVHDGVYVDHTGPLTWLQQAWAAVLLHEPAALSHDSALRAVDGPGRRDRSAGGPVHVAVDRSRTVTRRSGIVVHQMAGFDSKALLHTAPPRIRVEEAALDVAAAAAGDLDAIAVLAGVVQARRTTAPRMLEALAGRARIGRRKLMVDVLGDVAAGTCSALEHSYLDRVERAHGLPSARRQVRDSLKGPVYRDVEYDDFGLVVELDGRLFHDSAETRDHDMERDLDTALGHRATVRLGWGQAHVRSCVTAEKVGRLLQARGWRGTVHPCPRCAVVQVRRAG